MKNSRVFPKIAYFALCAALTAAGYWYGHSSALTSSVAKTFGKPHSATTLTFKGGSMAAARLNTDNQATLDDLMKLKGRPDATDLAIWARGLSPEECAAVLAKLQNQPAGNPRDAILDAVIKSWAGRDPQGFLSAADGLSSPRLREQGVDAALKALAASNPQEALQWLKDNPGDGSTANQQARMAAAIAGYAAANPTDAFNYVNGMAEDTPANQRLKNQALQAFVSGLADSGRFSDGLALFGAMADGPQKNQALMSLGQSWAQSAPVDAANWISSLTDPNLKNQLSNQLLTAWSGSDPAAAAAWAAKADAGADPNANANGFPGQNNNLLANVINSWAGYDLDGAGKYLNTLPASAEKDGAVASFAVLAGQQDPAGAMGWVSSVSDDGIRERLALVTALQWESVDATGANQFLATTTLLTDADKNTIANIPPFVTNMLTGNGPGGPGGGPGGRGGPGGFGGGLGGGGPGGGGPGGGVTQMVQSYIVNGNGNILTGGGPGGFGGRGGRGGGGG